MTTPKSLSQRTRENAEENARLRRAVMALREALILADCARPGGVHCEDRVFRSDKRLCARCAALAEHNL